jgi:glycosyltransferase involved in cell wall biosynthesis
MTNSDIKISIIIPVYNAEKYLRQCLDSAVNQTLKDIEIICVDDCSTDGSYAILQEYAAKDSRFVILKQEKNQGQAPTRNKGLDNANGEFIMFMDNDDWLEPDACELCYNQITENNNDVVIFGFNKYFEKYGILKPVTKSIKPFLKLENKNAIDLSTLNERFIVSCFIWTLIYRRELIEKHNMRFSNLSPYEDNKFFIEVFIHSKTISVLNKFLYNYRVINTSNTFSNPKKILNFYKAKTDNISLIDKYNVSETFKKAIFQYTIRSSVYWYNRYTQIFPRTEKSFYNSVRDILMSLDKEYVEKEIHPELDEYIYEQYKYFIENTYSQHLKNKNDNQKKANSFIEYKKVFKLISWMFPDEEDKFKLKTICDEADERKYLIRSHLNRSKILNRIRNKKEKLKILFMVNDIQKWKAQSLYDLMAQYEKIEPVICLHIAEKSPKLETLLKNKEYFETKGMNTIIAHDLKKNKAIDLKEFNPDIVFYQQTDYISKNQSPVTVSQYALTCYIPNHLSNYNLEPADYDKSFYSFLFRYYITNNKWKIIYNNLSDLKNLYATGNPMLDYLYLNQGEVPEKNYVIYAPHWSFYHEKNKNNMRLGTFLWNGKEILDYAKSHTEVNWVFMPDEKLKKSLTKIGLSAEDVDEYYREWEKIAKTCYNGDYTELFLESKLLITDGDTYMTEYFYSGKPIIHLISSDCRVDAVKFVQKNFDTLYKVHNTDEMLETFDRVILKSDDYKYEERIARVNSQYSPDRYAASNILDNIIKAITV